MPAGAFCTGVPSTKALCTLLAGRVVHARIVPGSRVSRSAIACASTSTAAWSPRSFCLAILAVVGQAHIAVPSIAQAPPDVRHTLPLRLWSLQKAAVVAENLAPVGHVAQNDACFGILRHRHKCTQPTAHIRWDVVILPELAIERRHLRIGLAFVEHVDGRVKLGLDEDGGQSEPRDDADGLFSRAGQQLHELLLGKPRDVAGQVLSRHTARFGCLLRLGEGRDAAHCPAEYARGPALHELDLGVAYGRAAILPPLHSLADCGKDDWAQHRVGHSGRQQPPQDGGAVLVAWRGRILIVGYANVVPAHVAWGGERVQRHIVPELARVVLVVDKRRLARAQGADGRRQLLHILDLRVGPLQKGGRVAADDRAGRKPRELYPRRIDVREGQPGHRHIHQRHCSRQVGDALLEDLPPARGAALRVMNLWQVRSEHGHGLPPVLRSQERLPRGQHRLLQRVEPGRLAE
eukprot:scaffold18425_cov112-Isochrysis_galbana.AAC.8